MIDLFFRQIYAFFIIEIGSRRVVHFAITSHPSDDWVAQQLREATPYGQTPRFLIRDRDSKYGEAFGRVAKGSSIEILKIPYPAPLANALCERFLASVRRECLDHILFVGDRQLHRVIKEYVEYFNRARPHQGIGQRIPEGIVPRPAWPRRGRLIAVPVLNGLHHDYRHDGGGRKSSIISDGVFGQNNLSEKEYLQEKERISLARSQVAPVEPPDLEKATEFLKDYSSLLATATDEERRLFFQTVLEDVFVDKKKVVAVRPKPNYYNLLRLSEAGATGVENATDIRILGPVEEV